MLHFLISGEKNSNPLCLFFVKNFGKPPLPLSKKFDIPSCGIHNQCSLGNLVHFHSNSLINIFYCHGLPVM